MHFLPKASVTPVVGTAATRPSQSLVPELPPTTEAREAHILSPIVGVASRSGSSNGNYGEVSWGLLERTERPVSQRNLILTSHATSYCTGGRMRNDAKIVAAFLEP